MAVKYYTEQNIQEIANVIREIEGVAKTNDTMMTVREMQDRIRNLIWTGTQEEYDALAGTGYSDSTLYIIFEDN